MMYLAQILGFLYHNIFPFVVLLGILVFVHELGHFLVARMCGVRVEVFSLGFGKKLFSYKKNDTTYCVSLIPLGGYVKMFGEQGSDQVITEEDKKVSYSHKNPWQRIAIVLAGPLMNFFFAIFVFAYIAQVGEQTKASVIGGVTAGSVAEKAGFAEGDRILEVNSTTIQSYDQFQKALNQYRNQNVKIEVETASGTKKTIQTDVSSADNPNIFSLESQLGQIEGLEPYAKASAVAVLVDSPAYAIGFRTGDSVTEINSTPVKQWSDLQKMFVGSTAQQELTVKIERPLPGSDDEQIKSTTISLNVTQAQLKKIKSLQEFGFDKTELYLDQVMKDSPAALAGLQRFDKIVAINSKPITKWEDILETVKAYDGKEALTFTVLRDGAELIKKITPKVTELTTAFGGIDRRYTVGIMPFIVMAEPEMTIVKSDSIFQSVAIGTSRTVDVSVMTVMSFVKLFQGHTSVKNLGGMVSIGKAAKDSFEMGWQAFLITMGILSVSLFILNLLPIPVLDGGHLVFYTIELVKGSPLSLRKMEIAQQIGFVLLMALMVLAQFNDIVKFLFKS